MILKWHQAGYVFPAHAGMIPVRCTGFDGAQRVPRTRGDDPELCNLLIPLVSCSPHTRG